MTVEADFSLENTKIGDSISVSGACLTATTIEGRSFSVDISPETLARSTFGKAKPGDKTVIDALHPAAEAFSDAVERGEDLGVAGDAMVEAAREGRDAIIPLRSQVGRASWVGERTENQPDPGAVLCVEILEAILDADAG